MCTIHSDQQRIVGEEVLAYVTATILPNDAILSKSRVEGRASGQWYITFKHFATDRSVVPGEWTRPIVRAAK